MDYYHVDVFSKNIFNGNGLTVVLLDRDISKELMYSITKEFRQFETIFIKHIIDNTFQAFIFTMEEELDFAGHPLIGASAVVHRIYFNDKASVEIEFKVQNRMVPTNSIKTNDHYQVKMNQGSPQYIETINPDLYPDILEALNLPLDAIHQKYPIETISTGLPYLLVPVKSDIEIAKIVKSNFEQFLSIFKAKFVYVFDLASKEARTWDNNGKVEDVATGSAAGPLCAYLVKHKIQQKNTEIQIHQGKYVGRPSIISTEYQEDESRNISIIVSGTVTFFGKGILYL